MPSQLTVVLRLDGVVHPGDLAVQSFARHVAERLPADRARAVIAGMRGFLEDKPELLGAAGLTPPQLAGLQEAEDGDRAVALLAAAAGMPAADIESARWVSRRDLAASAWLVDPVDGLDDVLQAVNGRAEVLVLSTPGDPAVGAVLDACGLTGRVETVTDLPVPAAAQRMVMIGTRWAGELSDAQAVGAATGMVDRFRRNLGTPTWRSVDLTGLLGPVRQWCSGADSGGTP